MDTKKVTKDMKKKKDCAICMKDFKTDDKVFALKCGHSFHVECLEPWLASNTVCPACRYDLKLDMPASEAAKHKPQPEFVDL